MSQLAALFSKLPNISRRAIRPASQKAVSAATAPVSKTDPKMQALKKSKAPSPLRKRVAKEPTSKQVQETAQATTSAAPRAAMRPTKKKTRDTSTTLSIPCPDPTLEERIRDDYQNRALKLVRQEDWKELSRLIASADNQNLMTPGGMSVAELLTFGARADVVMAAEHALIDSVPEHDAPLIRGIEALEYVLAEHSDDYIVGCIVAHAHMDLAWAWRGVGWDVEIAPRNREAFDAHFSRARDIMQAFNGALPNSALLATTNCALLRGHENDTKSVADRYEALIDLNPHNTSPMRALGTHMLPRWYGSYQGLELEARRTAARTQEIWGAGGYTWVMFDAISHDDTACASLDLPFFIEGMRDIAAKRPDPHTINLLAAYCANTMGNAFSGNDSADANRAQISDCADWLVREHLTELHPMIWAHAAQGFANNLRVASAQRFAAAGQDDALRIIAGLFRREIADGKQIVFTDNGPIATPS